MKKIIIVIISLLLIGLAFFVYTNNKKEEVSDLKVVNLFNTKEKGKLIVGSSPPYGLMEFYNELKIMDGFDIDIAKEIASKLNLDLKMVDIPFDSLDKAVTNGEVDMAIASISITPNRLEKVLFSTPYFSGGMVFVVKNDKNMNVFTDLNGKNIGVEFEDGDSRNKKEVSKNVFNPLFKVYKQETSDKPYPEKVSEELKNNKIDAFVIDFIAAISLVKDHKDFKILGDPFTQDYYAITSKLGNDLFMNEVNKIIQEMKRVGKLKEFEAKWFK